MMYRKALIAFIIVVCVKAENQCEKSEDCDLEGSICSENICICPPNTIANSLQTKCLPVPSGYGSSCVDNVQCSYSLQGGGICENNTCICTNGYHYFLGECWKTAGLNESCKHNENCFVSNDFEAAVCSEKKVCVCSPGYYQREYSSCRRESYSPGDPCGISLDCKFENPVCNANRTCEVNASNTVGTQEEVESFKYKDSKTIKVVEFLSEDQYSCQHDKDCPKNSVCQANNLCGCKKGYFSNGTDCLPELGAPCDEDKDCVGKNTQCRNGTVCVCKQGYVTSYNNQYCDKMSRFIAWSCLRDEECALFGPHTICFKKKCHCDDNSHYVEGSLFCWVQKLIGEGCFEDEDCGGDDTATCTNGKCQCKPSTHPSSDKRTCHKDSNKVGEQCIENTDCTFDNSFCDSELKKCSCLGGYINSDGKCVPGVGGKCTNSSDCKAEGSICTKRVCKCEDGFISSQDYSKCLDVINNLNETCSETSQCSKVEGICTNGFCSCVNGSHYVEGSHCFISRTISQSCTSYGNCSYIPHTICRGNKCVCTYGYHALWNSTCVRNNGFLFHSDRLTATSILLMFYFLRKTLFY